MVATERRFEGAMQLALKIGKGAMNQGMQLQKLEVAGTYSPNASEWSMALLIL